MLCGIDCCVLPVGTFELGIGLVEYITCWLLFIIIVYMVVMLGGKCFGCIHGIEYLFLLYRAAQIGTATQLCLQ